jgi:hypothetical protein
MHKNVLVLLVFVGICFSQTIHTTDGREQTSSAYKKTEQSMKYTHARLEYFKNQSYYEDDLVLKELIAVGETYLELPKSLDDVLTAFEKAYSMSGSLSFYLNEKYHDMIKCYDMVPFYLKTDAPYKKQGYQSGMSQYYEGKEKCSFHLSLLFTDKKQFMEKLDKGAYDKQMEILRAPVIKELETLQSILSGWKKEEEAFKAGIDVFDEEAFGRPKMTLQQIQQKVKRAEFDVKKMQDELNSIK